MRDTCLKLETVNVTIQPEEKKGSDSIDFVKQI